MGKYRTHYTNNRWLKLEGRVFWQDSLQV